MKLLKYLVSLLLFVIIIIEEAFWSVFETFSAFFERFELVQKIEAFVESLRPATCLTLFLIPVALMFPFKFAGLWLIAHGHSLEGMFVFLAAKATGTFLAARLFAITKPKLLTIVWFATAYYRFTGWKNGIKAYIHATAAYKTYLTMRTALRQRLSAFSRRRDRK